jgi:hypothetical protein
MRTLGTRRAVLVAGVAGVTAAALAACGTGQVAETALKNASVYGVSAQNSNRSVLIRGLAVVYNNTAGYPAGSNAPLEVNFYNETKETVTVLVSSQPPTQVAEKDTVVSARSVTLVGGQPTTPSTAIPEPSGSRPAATPDPDVSDVAVQPSSDASSGPSGTSPSAGPSGTSPSAGPSGTAPSAGPSGTAPSAGPSGGGDEATGRPARIEIGPLGYAIFRSGTAETLQVVGLTDRLVPGTSVNLVFEFSNGAEPLVVQAPMAVPLSPASRAPGNPAEDSGEVNPGEEN